MRNLFLMIGRGGGGEVVCACNSCDCAIRIRD